MGAFNGIPESWTSKEFADKEVVVSPLKEATRQARESLDILHKTVGNPVSCFQKLYLVFEQSRECGYLCRDLCDIFTTRDRANLDLEERVARLGKATMKRWGIKYEVQCWEVQE